MPLTVRIAQHNCNVTHETIVITETILLFGCEVKLGIHILYQAGYVLMLPIVCANKREEKHG
jgi:hypothetical protein